MVIWTTHFRLVVQGHFRKKFLQKEPFELKNDEILRRFQF